MIANTTLEKASKDKALLLFYATLAGCKGSSFSKLKATALIALVRLNSTLTMLKEIAVRLKVWIKSKASSLSIAVYTKKVKD